MTRGTGMVRWCRPRFLCRVCWLAGAFDGVGVVGLMHRVRPVPGDM